MVLAPNRPKITDVFSPRAAVVNKAIYIERPELEKELTRALNGALHAIIYGESGSGKSWLYKKVLDDLKWYSVIANCANAARLRSLTEEIVTASTPQGAVAETGYSETKGVGVSGTKLEHKKEFIVKDGEPLREAFRAIRKEARDRPAILVLDNLESMFTSSTLMEELGNVITLLDDQRYAEFRIKILIVGTPTGVIEYFSRIPNLHTVANRLQEITEVRNLTEDQCNSLTYTGLRSLLSIDIDEFAFANWQDHIYFVTFGVPQRVHEYCEQLAYVAADAGWRGQLEHIDKADGAWLKIGLRESYHMVQNVMNERETKVGRRNQVLFTLGKMSSKSFTTPRVEETLRIHFPNSTADVMLGVGQILGELAEREKPVVKRTPKGDEFEFTDPRYAMAIRAMLRKNENENVVRVEL